MKPLYHFKRSRSQTAKSVLLNMLVLVVMFGLLHHFVFSKPEHAHLAQVVLYGLVGVELVLAAWLLWLLANPASFEILVTEQRFSVSHPTFKKWSFTVDPKDIASVKNLMIGDGDHRYETRLLTMKSGETYEICRNYRYSVSTLYAALQKANPNIVVPKNPHLFKVKD